MDSCCETVSYWGALRVSGFVTTVVLGPPSLLRRMRDFSLEFAKQKLHSSCLSVLDTAGVIIGRVALKSMRRDTKKTFQYKSTTAARPDVCKFNVNVNVNVVRTGTAPSTSAIAISLA